ncbi:MAG: CDP-glycerol glycerophosphotransferase family protein [Candidatus Schekmanbacteria bacterium]|nr:CDP-glycerol glycerophosphotransferase family protein [Candidatus Schekmanbacteria bacterium]
MIKTKKKKILFYIATPMNYAILKPIYEALKEDERLDIRFTLRFSEKRKHRNAYPFFSELGEEKIIIKKIARLMKFDMLLCCDFGFENNRIPVKIHLFHGVSFRNSTVRGKISNFDKLFIAGPYMKRLIEKRRLLPAGDHRMEMTGIPKLDRLLDGTYRKEEILKGLNLDPSLPTIMYAPTHSESSSIYTYGEEILKYMSGLSGMSRMKVNFLIKLHDLLFDPDRNSVDWRKLINEKKGENTRLIEDYDIVPYMCASDILISDASSVANEFTLLDRPIIFLDSPQLLKDYEKTLDLDTWGRKAGTVASSIRELDAAIGEALKNPKEKSKIRKAVADDIFCNHGKATKAAVESIYRLLKMEKT